MVINYEWGAWFMGSSADRAFADLFGEHALVADGVYAVARRKLEAFAAFTAARLEAVFP